MNIEELIYEDGLPVNTIAMANRLVEILKENNTNSALSLSDDSKFPGRDKGLLKFQRCLWLINSQVYGQLGKIDMDTEWTRLSEEFREKKGFIKLEGKMV
jgi:hypothetical protein